MSLASLTATHRVTAKRPKNDRDLSGGVVKTWQTLHPFVSIPVTIQPLSAREQYLFAQRQVIVTHRVYTAVDVRDLRRDDRLEDQTTGRTYVMVNAFDEAGSGRVFSTEVHEQAP